MAGTHFGNVAEYLLARRSEMKLSQEAMADLLADRCKGFEGVDGLALSRWERGVVSPSIERQIRLMQFFGDEPHLLLGNREFEVKQLPSLDSFHKWMGQHLQYNHVMGGHPYVDGGDGDFEKCGPAHDDFSSWAQLVCRYTGSLTQGREKWSVEMITRLTATESSDAVFYTCIRQLIGHLLLIRVNDQCLSALLKGEVMEHELRSADLCDESMQANLFVLSAYVGNREICMDVVTHMFSALLENPANRSLAFKARANFGVKLMDVVGGEVVAKGPIIGGPRDGARYNGKYYEHVSYQLGREALISSPTLLSILRA